MNLKELFNPKKTLRLFGLDENFIFFRNLIKNKKLPKATLITGNKGIGKFTLVNHLMFSIYDKDNYDINKNIILGESVIFKQIMNNSFSNVLYLNNSLNDFGIEEVRRLKAVLLKKPFEESERYIILDNIETLNINSLNALLKTIEEPSKNNSFILINNKSKPLLETIKSRCLEVNINLKENIRKAIIISLIEYFDQGIFLNHNLVHTTPGNFIKFNHIFRENKIEVNNDFLKNLLVLINLYKKEKDIYYKESLLFFVDYFLQFKRLKKIYDNKKFIEKRSFLVKSISDFFMLNLNQNTFINSIESQLLDE
tara:strand:+ start:267 stop:1199 length:933 start_codon:yes stop_codon:yes gene_type:complete